MASAYFKIQVKCQDVRHGPKHGPKQNVKLMSFGKFFTPPASTITKAVITTVRNLRPTRAGTLIAKSSVRQFYTWSESADKKKLMDRAIQRFIMRLSLPDSLSIRLIDCRENNNDTMLDKFNSQKRAYKVSQLYNTLKASNNADPIKILQLYHGQSDSDNSESICNTGFHHSCYGNKGVGVYLANHSRYAWNWAGTRNPVIVCDVIADDRRVSRFRSEIYSPTWNSEYVVNDPVLVYPRYILRYEIDGSMPREIPGQIGYVEHGKFGCVPCDSKVFASWKGSRCDCKLVPMVDPQDVVEED